MEGLEGKAEGNEGTWTPCRQRYKFVLDGEREWRARSSRKTETDPPGCASNLGYNEGLRDPFGHLLADTRAGNRLFPRKVGVVVSGTPTVRRSLEGKAVVGGKFFILEEEPSNQGDGTPQPKHFSGTPLPEHFNSSPVSEHFDGTTISNRSAGRGVPVRTSAHKGKLVLVA